MYILIFITFSQMLETKREREREITLEKLIDVNYNKNVEIVIY